MRKTTEMERIQQRLPSDATPAGTYRRRLTATGSAVDGQHGSHFLENILVLGEQPRAAPVDQGRLERDLMPIEIKIESSVTAQGTCNAPRSALCPSIFLSSLCSLSLSATSGVLSSLSPPHLEVSTTCLSPQPVSPHNLSLAPQPFSRSIISVSSFFLSHPT